jgi:hypothetical protein
MHANAAVCKLMAESQSKAGDMIITVVCHHPSPEERDSLCPPPTPTLPGLEKQAWNSDRNQALHRHLGVLLVCMVPSVTTHLHITLPDSRSPESPCWVLNLWLGCWGGRRISNTPTPKSQVARHSDCRELGRHNITGNSTSVWQMAKSREIKSSGLQHGRRKMKRCHRCPCSK